MFCFTFIPVGEVIYVCRYIGNMVCILVMNVQNNR